MNNEALEFDFDTQEGRDAAKKTIIDLAQSEDKEQLGEFLYALTEFVVKHEVQFQNIKGVIE